MAKYLTTVVHSIVSDRILVHNRIICTLLRSKFRQYSSNAQNYCDDSHIENDCIERKEERLLKVAIVGVPNAGKSSIINSIVKRNVSIIHLIIRININILLY